MEYLRICLLNLFVVNIIIFNLPLNCEARDAIDSSDSIYSTMLKELSVTASSEEHIGNRDSYIVTKNMCKNARNAGDLLQTINCLIYSPIDQSVRYMGSSKIKILIDSIERDENYIKRMSASRFGRIDVISFPTGKYADYDVLINYHTKKHYQGSEGYILGEPQFQPDNLNGKHRNLTNAKAEGSFTYTRDNCNIMFHISWLRQDKGFSNHYADFYPLNDVEQSTVANAESMPNSRELLSQTYATIAFDYDINPGHSVSVQWMCNPQWLHSREKSTIISKDNNLNVSQTLTKLYTTDMPLFCVNNIGLFYRGNVRSWKLNSSMGYHTYASSEKKLTSYGNGNTYIDDKSDKLHYLWGHIEASKWLVNNKLQILFSENISYANYSQNRISSRNSISNSKYLFNTLMGSLYFYPSQTISIGATIGIRTEYTSRGDKKLPVVVPRTGLWVSFTPSNMAYVRFNYSTNIKTPPIERTVSYGHFTDSLIYREGNPKLKSNFKHDVLASVTLWRNLTFSLRYLHSSNAVYEYATVSSGLRPDGLDGIFTNFKWLNGMSDMLSGTVSYNKQFNDIFIMQIEAILSKSWVKCNESKRKIVSPELNAALYINIPHTGLMLLPSYYLTRNYTIGPQNVESQYIDIFSIAVMKSIGKFTAYAVWTSPLHLIKKRMEGKYESPSYIRYSYGDNCIYRSDNRLRFILTYQFNTGMKTRHYNRELQTLD